MVSVFSTNAILTWDMPADPNGIIISYNLEVLPLSFIDIPFLSLRRKKQIEENVLVCYQFLNVSHLLQITTLEQTVNLTLCKHKSHRLFFLFCLIINILLFFSTIYKLPGKGLS